MHLFSILADLRFQDALDILFLTVVTYYLYLWFWGTKAFKALVGLLVLGIIFTLARTWGLFLTTWVFQILWQVLVFLLIILFQSEIRQVLERVNPLQALGLHSHLRAAGWVPGLAETSFLMARRKIGALVIIERLDRVEELVTGSIELDAKPTPEILLSIFQKESPLHDGAALIRKGKITRVTCYLPLTSAEGLPKEWGTRHRAALGLSERCDASVVVVSEERGEVSVAQNGKMYRAESTGQLTALIMKAIAPPAPMMSWWERIRLLLVRRWHIKLGALALTSIVWLLLAGQQNFEVKLKIPVELKNIPENMVVVEPVNPEVQLTVRGLRKDASILNKSNVQAIIDLSQARYGNRIYRITRDQVVLPNDKLQVVNIEPSAMDFQIGRPTKTK